MPASEGLSHRGMAVVHATVRPLASRCSNSSGDPGLPGFGLMSTILPLTSSGIETAPLAWQSPLGIGPNTARASSPNRVMRSLALDAGAQKMSPFQARKVAANSRASSRCASKVAGRRAALVSGVCASGRSRQAWKASNLRRWSAADGPSGGSSEFHSGGRSGATQPVGASHAPPGRHEAGWSWYGSVPIRPLTSRSAMRGASRPASCAQSRPTSAAVATAPILARRTPTSRGQGGEAAAEDRADVSCIGGSAPAHRPRRTSCGLSL